MTSVIAGPPKKMIKVIYENTDDAPIFVKKHNQDYYIELQFFDCEKSNLEDYHCTSCRFRSGTLIDLRKHVIDKHSVLKEKGCVTPNKEREDCSRDKLEYIHNLTREEKSKYRHKCEKCSYYSKSIFFMVNHVKRHNFPLQLFDCERNNLECYYCRSCKIKFQSLVQLKEHIDKKCCLIKTKKFKCEHCKFRTNQKNCLVLHQITAKHTSDRDKKWLDCDRCEYKTVWKKHLKEHFLTKHTNLTYTKQFDCDRCTFKTNLRTIFNNHYSMKHGNHAKWFECDKCPLRTTHKGNFKKHILAKHTPKKKKMKFECGKCKYKSNYKTDFNFHFLAKHTEDKDKHWFKCDKCSFKTLRKRNFKNHMFAKHTNPEDKEWYECDKCMFRTACKESINKHFCEKFFKCDECDFETRWKQNLVKHKMLKHTADEDKVWFRCENCSYKTTMKSKLTRHFRARHTGKENKKKWFQ